MRSTLIPAAIILIFAAQLPSQQPADTVDYAKQVQPIFNTCAACHIGPSASAGLHLDTAAGALAGSNAGMVIIPGNSKGSLLVQRISDTTGNQMPPSDCLPRIRSRSSPIGWIKARRSDAPAPHPAAAPARRDSASAPVTTIASAATERSYFEAYCFTCHSGPDAPMPAGDRQARHRACREERGEVGEGGAQAARRHDAARPGMPRPDAENL